MRCTGRGRRDHLAGDWRLGVCDRRRLVHKHGRFVRRGRRVRRGRVEYAAAYHVLGRRRCLPLVVDHIAGAAVPRLLGHAARRAFARVVNVDQNIDDGTGAATAQRNVGHYFRILRRRAINAFASALPLTNLRPFDFARFRLGEDDRAVELLLRRVAFERRFRAAHPLHELEARLVLRLRPPLRERLDPKPWIATSCAV